MATHHYTPVVKNYPYEFAASGVAVDVSGDRIGFGSASDLAIQSNTAGDTLQIRDRGDTGMQKLHVGTIRSWGTLNLAVGGPIASASGSNIQLLPDTGGITKVGNASTTSHGLNTNDDLFVTGKLEVDALGYFDTSLMIKQWAYFSGNVRLEDGTFFHFGDSDDVSFKWDDANGLVDCITGGGGPLALPAPTAAPTLQTASTLTHSVDEANDELDITVKYSDGTVHTGTVTLV